MRCHRCKIPVEKEDFYCRKCNTRIKFDKTENICSCGRKLEEDEKFCYKCGAQIIPDFSIPGEADLEF